MRTDTVYAFLKNKTAKTINKIQISFKNVVFILRFNTFFSDKTK